MKKSKRKAKPKPDKHKNKNKHHVRPRVKLFAHTPLRKRMKEADPVPPQYGRAKIVIALRESFEYLRLHPEQVSPDAPILSVPKTIDCLLVYFKNLAYGLAQKDEKLYPPKSVHVPGVTNDVQITKTWKSELVDIVDWYDTMVPYLVQNEFEEYYRTEFIQNATLIPAAAANTVS